VNFGAALGKPFSNIKNLIIGLVLMIIPIVNIFTITGYFLRIANKTMNGDNSLPDFDNFGELIMSSVKAIGVGLVYGIIWMVVSIILGLIPIVGPILSLVWGIAFMFVMLSAIMTLARTGSASATIRFGEVIKRTLNANFIVSVIVGAIVALVILAIIGIVLIMLLAAPLLPVIMGGTTDPTAIAAMVSQIMGMGLIATVVLIVVEYILAVFFYSLVAEAYPQ